MIVDVLLHHRLIHRVAAPAPVAVAIHPVAAVHPVPAVVVVPPEAVVADDEYCNLNM